MLNKLCGFPPLSATQFLKTNYQTKRSNNEERNNSGDKRTVSGPLQGIKQQQISLHALFLSCSESFKTGAPREKMREITDDDSICPFLSIKVGRRDEF